jgi:OmpA family
MTPKLGPSSRLAIPPQVTMAKRCYRCWRKNWGKLPNHVSIEGHTDSKPYAGRREYGNWELSTDRANAARRLMQHDGLRGDEVSEVRSYADQMQRTPAQPLDASNRRISVIVQNLEPKPQELEKTDRQPETSAAPKDPRKRGLNARG